MFNLYIFQETLFNGYNYKFLHFLYYSSIFSSILVIISKNPIISVLFLISLFINISAYLITLGLNFIGISYLLVYVGAVSILFLFILMLINIRISELTTYTYNSIPLAIIISIFFLYPLNDILPYYKTYISFNYINNFFINNDTILLVTSKTWDCNLIENSHASAIGNVLYSNYFIWIIITSLVLLLAMVGTICLVIS